MVLKIFLILSLLIIFSCGSSEAPKEPPQADNRPTISPEEAARFEREFIALVEQQRRAENEPQKAIQAHNNNEEAEIARARREIEALEREAHRRNLEYDREIKKRQLVEWQAYKADLDRQIAENNERERKARAEIDRLRRQQVDAEKSSKELIDRINKSSQ